jgi:hypothetical protein
MEVITHVLEDKGNGTKIVKNFFLYPNEGNIMAKAHLYFTKDQKKTAKLNYKEKIYEREMLIQYLLAQTFPKMNLKVSLLNNFKNK